MMKLIVAFEQKEERAKTVVTEVEQHVQQKTAKVCGGYSIHVRWNLPNQDLQIGRVFQSHLDILNLQTKEPLY